MSIEVVKAFVRMRHAITSQKDILRQLSEVRSFILKQTSRTDIEFKKVWKAIEELTKTDDADQIGFKID